ncbi:phosphoglucosamine mutase [candidate division GN15 bacterium]|nr:phosphoglucosamine mutase [candidate division GN15 bacterium]
MKKKELKESTSGVRGVIGNGLDPILAAEYAAAFGTMVKSGPVILGRDSRPTGGMIRDAVVSALSATGVDVIDVGVVPTPTVEIAVKEAGATGGICITASHNPAQWNALKFFSAIGDFVTPAQFAKLKKIKDESAFRFVPHQKLGSLSYDDRYVNIHIKKVLALKVVKKAAIKKAGFTVVVDAINGAGSRALPELLERLGAKVIRINCTGNGDFVHEPEPVAANLKQLGQAVKRHKADLGMACDPDADRLALVDHTGHPIGEELTLAIAVQHVLSIEKGPTVINLSTSSVTAEAARAAGSRVYLARVGEANVVELMRKKKAVIGGEGNGGVIYPKFHAGRDSLVAAAMTLSAMAAQKKSLADLVKSFGRYYTIKTKAAMPDDFVEQLRLFEKASADLLGKTRVDRQDGLRFDFPDGWVQIRASNTEPIYRLIIETNNERLTARLGKKVKSFFK